MTLGYHRLLIENDFYLQRVLLSNETGHLWGVELLLHFDRAHWIARRVHHLLLSSVVET